MNDIVLNTSYLPVIAAIIFLPIIAGIVLFVFPERIKNVKGIISLFISAFAVYGAYYIFAQKEVLGKANISDGIHCQNETINSCIANIGNYSAINIDSLSKLITLLIGFFCAGATWRGSVVVRFATNATRLPSSTGEAVTSMYQR